MQPAAADRAKSELSKQVRRNCKTHSEHLLDFQLAICDRSGAQEWTHCSIQQHKMKRCNALPGFELTHTSAAANVKAAESDLYAYLKY